MKLHFSDTEIAFAPMLSPEIQYWLGKGHKIFKHSGTRWMRITHYKGHRVLIEVPERELSKLDTHWFNTAGIVTEATDAYRMAIKSI